MKNKMIILLNIEVINHNTKLRATLFYFILIKQKTAFFALYITQYYSLKHN